jgi:hypothetical protein
MIKVIDQQENYLLVTDGADFTALRQLGQRRLAGIRRIVRSG